MPVTSFTSANGTVSQAEPAAAASAVPPASPGLAAPAGTVGHGTTRLFAPRPITVDRTPGVAPTRPELAGIRHEGNVRLKV
jgi:hypothetical protein